MTSPDDTEAALARDRRTVSVDGTLQIALMFSCAFAAFPCLAMGEMGAAPAGLLVPAAVLLSLACTLGILLARGRTEVRAATARLQRHHEREQIRKLKRDLADAPHDEEDPRAVACRRLVARIEQLGDHETVDLARRAGDALTAALGDTTMLRAALELDREASRDDTPDVRLADALHAREEHVEGLVSAIRDLHAALTLQDDEAARVLSSLRTAVGHAQASAEVHEATTRSRRGAARSRVRESS